jgi:superfamily II DNA or RNA helicase
MTEYLNFLERKMPLLPSSGIEVDPDAIHPSLFPFQRDLVRWALRKGRSAIFATTGLGKTRMQLEWGRLIDQPVLFVAPLAVAQQTVREAASIGIELTYARSHDQANRLTITNYEMVDRFDASQFGAVVLDESSILKSQDGKTRTRLIEQFARTPYRLCCTATPAPNDTSELANHAEFLGVLTRPEMLATFFVHDMDKHKDRTTSGWRLKGHAQDPFYRWLASWGMSVQKPSDLGYDDALFALPPLSIESVILPTDYVPPGQLFATTLKGIGDRAAVRKQTIGERVSAAVSLVQSEQTEPWLIWVGQNAEGQAMQAAIPGSVNVEGSQSPDQKADALMAFVNGDIRVLITKPTIAGFGMNFQHCARMIFVGLGDSYEQYFQTIRRCWRFGQKREVKAYIVLTEPEETIYRNVLRKEREATATAAELVKHVAAYERAEIGHARQQVGYEPAVPMRLPEWLGVAA